MDVLWTIQQCFFFLLHTLAVAFYLMVCVWLQHKCVYDKCRLKCEIGNQNAQQVGTWILSVCAVSGHFPSCDCTQIKVHPPPPAHSSTCMYFCNTASYPLLRNTHLFHQRDSGPIYVFRHCVLQAALFRRPNYYKRRMNGANLMVHCDLAR